MSIEDVKNGGPASWYVGTDEAIRENRGGMGTYGAKISPEQFIEKAGDAFGNFFGSEDGRYGSAIQDYSDDESAMSWYLLGFLKAIAMFCPERLEK